jgi:serine/threonine protein kinase
MEYCECTLEEICTKINNDPLLKNNNLLNENGLEIMSGIFKQILEGVNYLHKREKPVMHRDLNSRNILLKKRQLLNGYEVKIADFNLSKVYYLNKPNTQDQGTIKFIAPEVKDGTKYDIKADIYSLGVILQKLLQIDKNEYVYYLFEMQ